MTELSRDARSLVARARVHEGPSPLDRTRLRAKLEPAWAAEYETSSAATASPIRALVRRVPIAKALVLLAVASWAPLQPSAARIAAPIAAPELAAELPVRAIASIATGASSGEVIAQDAASGSAHSNPAEPVQPDSGRVGAAGPSFGTSCSLTAATATGPRGCSPESHA